MCEPGCPEGYVVRVRGHVAPERFEGLKVTLLADGETTLSGPVRDQAALHGLLAQIRDLNLTLISLNPLMPEPPRGDQDGNPKKSPD